MANRHLFREQLAALFTIEELETICNDLDVDPQAIPGRDKGKLYFVDQLISYLKARERLPELQAALKTARPNADWQIDLSAVDVGESMPAGRISLPRAWMLGGGLAVLLVAGLVAFFLPRAPDKPQPPVPTGMPRNGFNIYVADIGKLDATNVFTMAEGQALSADSAETLRAELNDPTVLPTEARSDFRPEVWGSVEARKNGWEVGVIANDADAERVARQIGAQLVIYGNFEITGTPKLTLGMYVPTAVNVADELTGRFSLGSPLDMAFPMTQEAAKGIQLHLNDRQRLMSRWAIGLAYDLYGRKEKALEMFLSAVEKAKHLNTGLDVSYFLVGREYLFLRKTQEAENAHKNALESNQNYVRAHIGLGDVYFQYATLMTPTLAIETDAFARAASEYAQAEATAGLQPEAHQLLPLARLGLGLTKVLQAAALDSIERKTEALPLFTDGIRLVEPALTEISRRPEGQRRTLALGYFWLAQAYRGLARMGGEGDKTVQQQQFKNAEANFDTCIKLDLPSDTFQHDEITKACELNKTRMINADMP